MIPPACSGSSRRECDRRATEPESPGMHYKRPDCKCSACDGCAYDLPSSAAHPNRGDSCARASHRLKIVRAAFGTPTVTVSGLGTGQLISNPTPPGETTASGRPRLHSKCCRKQRHIAFCTHFTPPWKVQTHVKRSDVSDRKAVSTVNVLRKHAIAAQLLQDTPSPV